MKPIIHLVAAMFPLAAGAAMAAHGSQVTLYKGQNFTGPTISLKDPVPNLAQHGFDNQASSAVVTGGRWELCSRPEGRGDCIVLEPGRYARLDQKVYHRMESARPAGEGWGGKVAAAQPAAPQVTLYKGQNLSGPTIVLKDAVPNLAQLGFQNQASGAVVAGSRWEFCSSPEGRGECVVLEPGRYERLDQRIYHRMESARPVGEAWPSKEKQRTALAQRGERRDAREARREDRGEAREERREERRDWRRADRAGAIDLYPAPDFRGRPLRLEHDVDTLDGSRMEERVSSLIVHDGVWQLCTRPGYEGRCRTFEPGQYPSLERLDDRIASLRQMR